MKHAKQIKRLVLSREAVRELSTYELGSVDGGAPRLSLGGPECSGQDTLCKCGPPTLTTVQTDRC